MINNRDSFVIWGANGFCVPEIDSDVLFEAHFPSVANRVKIHVEESEPNIIIPQNTNLITLRFIMPFGCCHFLLVIAINTSGPYHIFFLYQPNESFSFFTIAIAFLTMALTIDLVDIGKVFPKRHPTCIRWNDQNC